MLTLADTINETLSAWLAGGQGSVVAVINTAGPLDRQRLAADGADLGIELLSMQMAAAGLHSELLPALVLLNDKNWLARQQTAACAVADMASPGCPLVCAWLWAHNPPSQLRREFESSLVRHGLHGGRYLFRHHDPRVRACLQALLGTAWLNGLLPSQQEWMFIHPRGHLVRQRQNTGAGDGFASVESHPTPQPPQNPTPQRAQQVIERCAEINQAIALAAGEGWAFVESAYACADAALSACEALGFAGAPDRLAFTLHALTMAGSFYRHPPIRDVLQTAQSHGLPYVEAAARISSEQWRAAAVLT